MLHACASVGEESSPATTPIAARTRSIFACSRVPLAERRAGSRSDARVSQAARRPRGPSATDSRRTSSVRTHGGARPNFFSVAHPGDGCKIVRWGILRCYLGDPDVPDSQSVYFFLLNSCSARAKLYVYFMRVHAISKSCNCTGRGRRAVEILNRAGRGAHFIHSEKCTCTDSSTDSSRARYFVPVA